jgi:hypothetical protein
MDRRLAVALLVALLIGATSPVWAGVGGNPAFDPDPADPGQSVSFTASITEPTFDAAGNQCYVYADTSEPPILKARCAYTKARDVNGWFLLPASATPGTRFVVLMCAPLGCEGAEPPSGSWSLAGTLAVAPTPVIVPTVSCESLGTAIKSLSTVHLTVSRTSFPGPVGSQVPTAGATITPTGGTASLYPAVVPILTGRAYPSASALVYQACGLPVPSGDTAGVVVSQAPSPFLPVPSDQRVIVYLSRTPLSPSSLTTSPQSSEPTTPASSSHLGGNGGDDGGGGLPGWVWPQGVLGLVVALVVGAASFVGVRTLRKSRLPEVNPTLAKVSVVGVPRLTTDLAEVALGPLSASFVVVRHPHTIHLEEHP